MKVRIDHFLYYAIKKHHKGFFLQIRVDLIQIIEYKRLLHDWMYPVKFKDCLKSMRKKGEKEIGKFVDISKLLFTFHKVHFSHI